MAERRFALLVANAHYADLTLARLEAPAHDAASLADALGSPAIGGFEVRTIVDGTAPQVMQEIESFFDGRARDDLVLLYFSGHGILDEGARLYFATADTRVDRPRSTSVPAGFVNDVMAESRSRRQVLVLDCCNSGAFGRGLKAGGALGTGSRFEGRGRVVITASDALQYAFEGDRVEGEGRGSVFTDVLVDGLTTGGADLDGDGYVTLDELYDYAYAHVVDSSPHQRPRKWAFEVEGRLVVARAAGAPRVDELPPALPAAPHERAATARPGRRFLAGRRRLLLVLAAAAVVAAGAIAAVALLRDDDGAGGAATTSLDAERNATLEVFEAWQAGELDAIPADRLSAAARRALTQMPVEPITPNPPGAKDCYGDPGDATCSYSYPDLDIYLLFRALQYSSGLRVADVQCLYSETGEQPAGGIAACAQMVRDA
jgi:uncharacterized caspase-like protein